jgi:DNA-binding CsgD family transcriptional regulator
MGESLRWDQLRGVFRLMGEAHELADDAEARRLHLVGGLGKLFNAQLSAMVIDSDFRPGGRGNITELLEVGWGNDSDRQRFVDVHMERGAAVHPCVASLMEQPAQLREAGQITAQRSDLLPDGDWYRAPFVQDCMRTCRYDDVLISVRATGVPNQIHGLAFHRAWGNRRFSKADRRLLQVFHQEGGYLFDHATRWSVRAIREGLSPRQRDTLDCLLSGHSEKGAAQRLGLSVHTVHVYVKALYRAFGVRSRAELLALHLRYR